MNQLLRKSALRSLLAYQRDGNKHEPFEVQRQFAFLLSYYSVLPELSPEFHRYLLDYFGARPANVEDSFYWPKVNFGLKPTVRLVHVTIMRGDTSDRVAFAIAEKQLYVSHYFAKRRWTSPTAYAAATPKTPASI